MSFKYILYREDATELGLIFYCTGKPCKHGHETVRYVSTRMCLDCRRMHENDRIRRNPEAHNTKGRIWYWKNPEKCRDRIKRCRAKNPEYHREKSLEYRRANRELCNKLTSIWQKANPEKIRKYANDRRARKLAAGGTYTEADIKDIFKMQKGKCAYCRTKLSDNRHIDHIFPLAKGGNNFRSNLQLLCAPCNMRKRAKDPVDFARSTGRLI